MRPIYGPIFTLRPYVRGIQEKLGRYNMFILPGLGFQILFIHITRVRDVREHTMDIHPQPVITKDNVEILVDGIMWVRPTIDEESIKKTFYNIDDWKRAVVQLAMTNLRQEFGDLTLDESLVAREMIATNLQTILNTYAVEWRLTVSKVEIRLIDPPEDNNKAMHKQKTAEQERRSMRLLATGEFEAAEKYFIGNAQLLKQMEMTENALRESAKIAITENGISPTLLLGSLPVNVTTDVKHDLTISNSKN